MNETTEERVERLAQEWRRLKEQGAPVGKVGLKRVEYLNAQRQLWDEQRARRGMVSHD